MPEVVSFVAPYEVALVAYDASPLVPGSVRVRTWYSGVSAGTELTAYRGSNPYLTRTWDAGSGLFVEGIPTFAYPVEGWGYSEVGEVVEAAEDVTGPAVGDLVYGIWGHRSEALLPGAAVAKCTTSFAAKWQKAEQKALDQGAACPSMGDEGAVRTAITAHVGCLASELATGDTTCLTCGDGVIDAGEDCDLGTVGGATCASASGGTLDIGTVGCSADCSFDMSACATCPGELVGGHCWLLGAPGASCDTTCTANGLAYDPATWFYAGSNGTNAQCGAVLDALGAAPGAITNTGVGGAGCFYTAGMTRIRDSRTTTSSYGTGTLRRACACE